MRMRSRLSVIRLAILPLILIAAGCALAQPAAQDDRVAEIIAWYDSLGFPDTTGRPYVRVATGAWTQVGNGPRVQQFLEGFLLEEHRLDLYGRCAPCSAAASAARDDRASLV